MDVKRKNVFDSERPKQRKYCIKLQANNLFTTDVKVVNGDYCQGNNQHLQSNGLFPEEQKGCRKESRGTKDQLMIDKMVLKNCRRRMTNLCLSWIDYKKAYDMVPHSWLMECTAMLGVALNVRRMLSNSMKRWKVELTSGGQTLGEVNIRRGIFQGDSLSPILFVMALIPLSEILRKIKMGYSLGKDRGKLNHLLFMDDLKLYGRNVNEIDSLIQSVRIFSQDIGMEFGIQKCAMLKIVRGKMVECEGISLPNGEKIRSLEKGQDYRYLGVLQCDTIKNKEMKELLRNEYFRRVRKMLKSRLNSGNVIQAINSRAVSVIRYGAGIVDWTKNELQEMDRKTRKLLTIYRSMHPQGDIDRLYMKRVAGGRGLQSVGETVELEDASLAFYLETKEEELLREVSREKNFGIQWKPSGQEENNVKGQTNEIRK